MRFTALAAVIFATQFSTAQAATIELSSSDFILTPVFNQISTFDISIDIQGPLAAGQSYTDPALNDVSYNIAGTLSGTPSGFPAFNLVRTGLTGAVFYGQGSHLEFGISAAANLIDGLQISELTSFVFNAREVDTGRYHPVFLSLAPDGTGLLQNSNNMGGINPSTNMVVDVDFGEEYVVNLAASPTQTIAAPVSPVPLPAALPLFAGGLGVLGIMGWRRRRKPAAAASLG